jgi:hypothetical protein
MRTRKTKIVMNSAAGLKPASQITDRAKRYRANSKANRPAPPKVCNYCGSRKNVGVDHVNGNESDGSKRNLAWACKSCNTAKGLLFKRLGVGVRTKQFNPGRGGLSRKAQLREYNFAILVMRGVEPGDQSKAMETILKTPASIRSEYTSRSWARRKAIYGPSGRADGGAVPF